MLSQFEQLIDLLYPIITKILDEENYENQDKLLDFFRIPSIHCCDRKKGKK